MLISLLLFIQAPVMPMPEFLSGCWVMAHPNGGWSEQCWTNARGGLMMGSRRDGKGPAIDRWEWMRIQRGPDGQLTYYRSINGEPSTAFRADRADAHSISFLNTSEYPHRINYVRSGVLLDVEGATADGQEAFGTTYRMEVDR